MNFTFKIEQATQKVDLERLDGAKTLLIGQNAATLDTFTGQLNNNYLVELRLRRFGNTFRRIFGLEPYRTVELSCEAYDSAFVAWRASGAGGVLTPLQVSLSSHTPNPAREELVYLPAQYAAGTWVTPPGARALRSASVDAGFTWLGYAPAAVNIPVPLASGQSYPVFGPLFVPTVGINVIWEIAL